MHREKDPLAVAGFSLVVVLQGAGGTAADMRSNLGWDPLADREGLVIAYPDGLDRTWNAGACAVDRPRPRGVKAAWGSSTRWRRPCHGARSVEAPTVGRGGDVYAVGFCNGAMMSYAWACARPGALAGIGPVAGALTVDCPAGAG